MEDRLPYPAPTERRSHFLLRFARSEKVKERFGGNPAKAASAAVAAWESARLDSTVSVTTSEDQFLVFEWDR